MLLMIACESLESAIADAVSAAVDEIGGGAAMLPGVWLAGTVQPVHQVRKTVERALTGSGAGEQKFVVVPVTVAGRLGAGERVLAVRALCGDDQRRERAEHVLTAQKDHLRAAGLWFVVTDLTAPRLHEDLVQAGPLTAEDSLLVTEVVADASGMQNELGPDDIEWLRMHGAIR